MIVRWVSQTKGEEVPKKEKPAEKKVKSEKEDKDKERERNDLEFRPAWPQRGGGHRQ